jgi:hypothetical protein
VRAESTAGVIDDAAEPGRLFDKRRLLLLVRTGLTLAIGYLLIFSDKSPTPAPTNIIFVVSYLASNIIIALLPDRILARAGFDIALILADTAAISFALLLIPDADTDVCVFYFTIILLASISDRLMLSLLAPVVTSGAYLAFLLLRHGLSDVLQPAILLRLPFFLLTGTFYAFFVDRVRRGQMAVVAAKQRVEARTELLSMITHDLKQPLWGRHAIGCAAVRPAARRDRIDTRAGRAGIDEPEAHGIADAELPRSQSHGDARPARDAAPHAAQPHRRGSGRCLPPGLDVHTRAPPSSSRPACHRRGSTRCRPNAVSPTCTTTPSSTRRPAAPSPAAPPAMVSG